MSPLQGRNYNICPIDTGARPCAMIYSPYRALLDPNGVK